MTECFRYLLLFLVGTYYLFVGAADGELISRYNIDCGPIKIRYSQFPLNRLRMDIKIVNPPYTENTPIKGMDYTLVAYNKKGDRYAAMYEYLITAGSNYNPTIRFDQNIYESWDNLYIAYCLYDERQARCDLNKDKLYTFIFLECSEDRVTDHNCIAGKCEITLDLNNYCKNGSKTGSGLVTTPASTENKTASEVVGEIGKNLRIRCPVNSGYPQSSITWFTPSGEVVDSKKYEVRGNELLIKSLSKDTLGIYRCAVGLLLTKWWCVLVRTDPGRPKSPTLAERTTVPPRTARSSPSDSPAHAETTDPDTPDAADESTVSWWLVGLLAAVSLTLTTVLTVVVKHYKRTANVQRQTIDALVEKVESLEAERRLEEEMKNRTVCPLPEETYDQVYSHGAGLKRPRRRP